MLKQVGIIADFRHSHSQCGAAMPYLKDLNGTAGFFYTVEHGENSA